MPGIHPTAIIEDGAEVADDVEIGPFTMVGARARISRGVRISSHVKIAGRTTIGENTRIYSFAAIGESAQDLADKGTRNAIEIGSDCVVREHVTINTGTEKGGGVTRIGNKCYLMIGCHIAHDCQISDEVLIVNGVLLGGHVKIETCAILGGGSGVHQNVRIGAYAFVGGHAGVENDVIPFGSVIGHRAHLAGLNLVGLKRRNFPREEIHRLRQAYKRVFNGVGTLRLRLDEVEKDYSDDQNVMRIINFIRESKNRAICTPRGDRPV